MQTQCSLEITNVIYATAWASRDILHRENVSFDFGHYVPLSLMNHPQDLFLIGVETDVLNIIITVKSVDFQSDCCEHKLLIPGELEHELHCDLFSVLASFILFQLHFLFPNLF